MANLQIKTGVVRLNILDDAGDERGIFTFNPTDIESAKRMFAIKEQLSVMEKEYQERAESCVTEDEKLQLLSDLVYCIEGLIDDCFGEGSSELLFGNAKTISMFFDFFDGIMPYYEKASNDRLAKFSQRSGK